MNKKRSMEELNRIDKAGFSVQKKQPFVWVLDNIRSLNNVGSFFRTADAFGIEKLVLTGITGQPPHRDIEKTALGATNTVEWHYFENSIDAIANLKQYGYQIWLVEQTAQSISLADFQLDLSKKYAFVFGNEVFGVSEELLDQADGCVEIPQFGTKHSLNVSVSCGIVAWEAARQHLGG